jgi:hypothetical protein
MMSDEAIYSVVVAGSNKINIINALNGTVVHSFTFHGTLENGPIVSGTRCTYVVRLLNGEKRGYIRKLPQGVVVSSFKV